MKVLVTGGSGLVGRYVVDELWQSHSVTVADLKPAHRADVEYHQVDVTDPVAVRHCIRGYDAVVHLAGIPHPLNNPAEEVFRVNALGTFNVLDACSTGGVSRFIFMSSESTLGFAFSITRLAPLYLPVDEEHILRPEDAYGLSKVTGELLCRAYSQRSGMETVCLRAPWIWVPEEKERSLYRQLVDEYRKWSKNLWAYIHVADVARVIALLLEAALQARHEIFFIAARENWTGRESRSLAKEFYPETHEFRNGFEGAASFISAEKARSLLGFSPRHSTSDIFA
jgi:UDP-glucose 4-epimerase